MYSGDATTPLVALSAAERYVADLIGECRAIADVFEVSCAADPGAREDVDQKSSPWENWVDSVLQEDEKVAAAKKKQLVARQLDPNKLAAWLHGAELPMGLERSQSPLMTALMQTPAAKPQAPLPPGHTPSFLEAFALQQPEAPEGWSTGSYTPTTAATPRGGAAAFFWGDTGGQAAGVDAEQRGDGHLAQRYADGDKPTLTGKSRESETHRLQRLLDPRYRRIPADSKSQPKTSNREFEKSPDEAASSLGRPGGTSPKAESDQNSSCPQPPSEKPSHSIRRGFGTEVATSNGEGGHRPRTAPLGRGRGAPLPSAPPSQPSRRGSKNVQNLPADTRTESKASDVTEKRQSVVTMNVELSARSKRPAAAVDKKNKVPDHLVYIPPAKLKTTDLRLIHGRPQSGRSQALANTNEARQSLLHLRNHVSVTQRKSVSEKLLREQEEMDARAAVSGVKDDLKSLFYSREAEYEKRYVNDTVHIYELHHIAIELKMSMEDVLLVKKIFDDFDRDQDGQLDIEEFDVAVAQLLRTQMREELPPERLKAMTDWYFREGDKDKSGSIDFREFLFFYSTHGFNEDLLLTEGEINLRKVAKSHGVSPDYVEKIKKSFDSCDTDHSGHVELHEFKEILEKCLKVPPNCGMPPSRVQHFWAEIDTDCSGMISFTEFFAWWLKYFDPESNTQVMPFESFYKQVRRIGASHLDPPAYPVHYPQSQKSDGLPPSILSEGLFGNYLVKRAQVDTHTGGRSRAPSGGWGGDAYRATRTV